MRYEVDFKIGFTNREVDAYWARCVTTRHSTSRGGVWFLGCLTRSWSTVQHTAACSSAESEYHILCSGVAESLFVRANSNVLGIYMSADAFAAKATSERTSLPTRAKHSSVRVVYLHSWCETKTSSQRRTPRMTIVLTFSRNMSDAMCLNISDPVFVCSMTHEAGKSFFLDHRDLCLDSCVKFVSAQGSTSFNFSIAFQWSVAPRAAPLRSMR